MMIDWLTRSCPCRVCRFITIMTVSFVLSTGQSEWLKGLMLIFAYVILGASYWAHCDPKAWLVHARFVKFD